MEDFFECAKCGHPQSDRIVGCYNCGSKDLSYHGTVTNLEEKKKSWHQERLRAIEELGYNLDSDEDF